MNKKEFKNKIHSLIEDNWNMLFPEREFTGGDDFIQYAGSIFDSKEINTAIDVLLDGWLGLNHKSKEFEKRLSRYIGLDYGIVVNSCSSAN